MMETPKRYVILAHAKVNACLLVTGKRPDGYHDILTIMAPIALADRLALERNGEGIRFRCADSRVPDDRRNLVVGAAESFFARAAIDADVTIELEKSVPPGAGLGGGSADAAATLTALNVLYAAPLSKRDLWALARDVGSDVPYFLTGGWALAAGRGEYVTSLPRPSPATLLLAAPRRSVSTSKVYAAVIAEDYSSDADAVWRVAAALNGDTLEWWPAGVNDLEAAARRTFPELDELKNTLAGLGYGSARLSGSGGTFFAPAHAGNADVVLKTLRGQGYWATLTETI